MTTLTIELPPDIYEKLRQRSAETGKSAQTVAEELIAEHLRVPDGEQSTTSLTEREQAHEVLHQARQLREPHRAWSRQERNEAVARYIREHPEEWEAMTERDRAITVLRVAGLLTELSPEEKERAKHAAMTLEEVRAALDRAGGKPLSEVIIEMRGPKG